MTTEWQNFEILSSSLDHYTTQQGKYDYNNNDFILRLKLGDDVFYDENG